MSSRPARGAARLAAILDALPDALLLVNGNGTVVNANAIAMETLEVPGAPLIGRGLLDIVPDFDPRRIPGSMRRPEEDPAARTKPTRMVARRTDGVELPVEVTSAGLNNRHAHYASAVEAAFTDDYSGEELLVLVVRDLSGTLDTEAELVRQQRQTEMILRAASEGVVGVDTAGRIVLVNPAAAQILGHRASQLGGQELHPLIQHSRADGSPLPYEETPLHDTLHSGRKHRVRGRVLWTKDGRAVPVDLTTAPVRDGQQLVGAVLTFTDRRPYDALVARHVQLQSVLSESLRGPLEQLRDELTTLAADPAGQLWPEANQLLHHLAAGYARMTTLVDNVLSYQRLDEGVEKLSLEKASLDEVVAAGVEGATELIGPGRVQFAVHAPPIDAEVDPERLAQALAHLIADVAGVDATGRGGGGDATIVVAAAQRGDVVRIEVRGPRPGGGAVHEPIVRGIVRQHGGVLQTHQVPGAGGSAYVLEVPVSGGDGAGAPQAVGTGVGAGRDASGDTTVMPVPAQPARGTQAKKKQPQPAAEAEAEAEAPSGRRRRQGEALPALPPGPTPAPAPAPVPVPAALPAGPEEPEGQGGTLGGRRRRALGPVPAAGPEPEIPQQSTGPSGEAPTGRRRRANPGEGQGAEPQGPVPAPAPAPEVEAEPEPQPVEHSVVASSPILDGSAPQNALPVRQPRALPMPGSDRAGKPDARAAVSVQTLGQGVPVHTPPQGTGAGAAGTGTHPGRRRKLAAPPAEIEPPQPAGPEGAAAPAEARAVGAARQAAQNVTGGGREFAISAPAAGAAEGPEPLDGPGGAVEVTEGRPGGAPRVPAPADDELPPEPLDNPRRLLVWPEPDPSTQQALTERGYRPVLVHSREEVDAQIAAYPAALFVDPLTGPITRTALQSLRQAAVAAEVPVLVTAGLGQASREAAYGADPAVLLKALAPRDSEQHPPRVLLVEEQPAIAQALAMSLERRGMQAAHAVSDAEAMEVAAQIRPNLVVMDLNQVRRRRAGIIDWLRINGLLSRTPFVVYTAAEMDPAQLPQLASGETVLFLAERSTHPEVQSKIVDLLTKIGAH
ncbi:PAS domain-containing protein [Streptomyces xiamenensis]|uniref:hybrid sensor histidine kinase/response regulator n=1 Tax=Streptomyces xiamenensis TaxID=408015 RepID=UPI00343160C7